MDSEQRGAIAVQVRRTRKAHEWTQNDLAEQAGVAPGTVVSVENARNVRDGNLRAVLDALGLSAAMPDREPVEDGIQLAHDLVDRWLSKFADQESRDRAVRELTMFLVGRIDHNG